MSEGISIVIPAYQEAENLRNILPKIRQELDALQVPYEVLVVDTMTKMDDTETVCKENSFSYVPRQGGNNYGDAIRTGFKTAQYAYTVVMDGDGSHDPKHVKEFLQEIQSGYDLIIGSRYTKGGNTQNPFVLKVMSYILNVTYRIFFGIKAKDISDSFRMYRTEQIQSIPLECDNFDIVEEILIKLAMSKKDYSIKEIPITFEERKAGFSKRSLGKFILSYLSTIKRLKKMQIKAKNN